MEETEVNVLNTRVARTNSRTLTAFIIRVKGILSTLILVLFIPVGFSGIGLYFAPSGRQARVSSWSFLGFSKLQLQTMHDIPGIILTATFILHFLLNIRIFLNEIKCLLVKRS